MCPNFAFIRSIRFYLTYVPEIIIKPTVFISRSISHESLNSFCFRKNYRPETIHLRTNGSKFLPFFNFEYTHQQRYNTQIQQNVWYQTFVQHVIWLWWMKGVYRVAESICLTCFHHYPGWIKKAGVMNLLIS